MAPETRSEICQSLEDSRVELNNSVAGVSEAQAKTSPAAGRWSVVDCVEHVTTVEQRFLGRLEEAERLSVARVDKQKESALMARLPNRSTPVQAPVMVQPSGRFPTLADALAGFHAVRARTIQFAEARAADLSFLALDHVRFGPVNGTEMLIIIAGHARRHAAQIREIRAALGIA